MMLSGIGCVPETDTGLGLTGVQHAHCHYTKILHHHVHYTVVA